MIVPFFKRIYWKAIRIFFQYDQVTQCLFFVEGVFFHGFILVSYSYCCIKWSGQFAFCSYNAFLFLDLYPTGLTGLEPAAFTLTGRCSDQLNYNTRERGVLYKYFYGPFLSNLFFFYFGFEPFCCKWKKAYFCIYWYVYRSPL